MVHLTQLFHIVVHMGVSKANDMFTSIRLVQRNKKLMKEIKETKELASFWETELVDTGSSFLKLEEDFAAYKTKQENAISVKNKIIDNLIASINKLQHENMSLVEQAEFPPDYFKDDLTYVKNNFLMNIEYAGMNTTNQNVQVSIDKVLKAFEDEIQSLENGNFDSRSLAFSNLCERELTYLLHECV